MNVAARISFVLFTAAIASRGAAMPQVSPCTVSGTLSSQDGTPISGGSVFADSLPHPFTSDTMAVKTDQTGHFELTLTNAVALASGNLDSSSSAQQTLAQRGPVMRVEGDGYAPNIFRVKCREDGGTPAPVTLEKVVETIVWRIPVVAMDFPDHPFLATETTERLKSMLEDDTPGVASLRRYFSEISEGRLRVEFQYFSMRSTRLLADLDDASRDDLTAEALNWVAGRIDLAKFDRLNNDTLTAGPDGRLDGILVVPSGPSKSMTGNKKHLNPVAVWHSVYDLSKTETLKSVYQVLVPFSAPLGNFAHEIMHVMGERKVQDLYMSCPNGTAAGPWELMDFGMYNPVQPVRSDADSWFETIGFSPSPPTAYVLTKRWFQGHMKTLVPGTNVSNLTPGQSQDFVINRQSDPRTTTTASQAVRIILSDSRYYEIVYRPRVGFERGRRAGLNGNSGILVTLVDGGLVGEMELRGPVRVIDAHATTPAPTVDQTCGAWKYDDAALALPGETIELENGWHVTLTGTDEPFTANVRLSR
jgi:M6 family metalloprotease-like protein